MVFKLIELDDHSNGRSPCEDIAAVVVVIVVVVVVAVVALVVALVVAMAAIPVFLGYMT